MSVKVSIIVPCYGVEKYLDRCMNSLVHQTLKDIEIILIDDESPDRVPIMCEEWAIKDSRIKVIHKKNGGLGFARNSGLEIASGEYVAFVDSDDFVELDMYEKLYEEAIQSSADAVFSDFFYEQVDGSWRNRKEVLKRKEWLNDDVKSFLFDMIASDPKETRTNLYQMSVWHSIYKRNIIQIKDTGNNTSNIRFRSERDILSEDLPFQIDFLLTSKKIVYIPDAFYHYCFNGSSLSSTFDVNKISRMDNLYNLLKSQLKNVEGYQSRIDYFYINYSRAKIQSISASDLSNKRYWIHKVCNCLISTGIPERFDGDCLKFERRLYYNLMVNNNSILLIVLSKVKKMLQSFRGSRY